MGQLFPYGLSAVGNDEVGLPEVQVTDAFASHQIGVMRCSALFHLPIIETIQQLF